jgi:hypothetical protein
MQILGIIVGALLLAFISSVAIGIISHSFVAFFSLIVLGLIVGAVVWTRRAELQYLPLEGRQLHDA